MAIVTKEEINEFLDELRESDYTNMFAAPSILKNQFKLSQEEASNYFWEWADNFGK